MIKTENLFSLSFLFPKVLTIQIKKYIMFFRKTVKKGGRVYDKGSGP